MVKCLRWRKFSLWFRILRYDWWKRRYAMYIIIYYIYLAFIADCENIIKIHESDINLYGERIRLE